MFLGGCTGVKPVIQEPKQEAVVQLAIMKHEKWLPTHKVTSQDFVFKNGKICTINSMADAYCSSVNNPLVLKNNSQQEKFVRNNTIDAFLTDNDNNNEDGIQRVKLHYNRKSEEKLGFMVT